MELENQNSGTPLFGDTPGLVINTSGVNVGVKGNDGTNNTNVPSQATNGTSGSCNTWSRCDNTQTAGSPGTTGYNGGTPTIGGRGDDATNMTGYVRDLLAPINVTANGMQGGPGGKGGDGGKGGQGGNGASGGTCCSSTASGNGGTGGAGIQGAQGGPGGNGGFVTVLYTNSNGFNLIGGAIGGAGGVGGAGGLAGPGGIPGTGGAGGGQPGGPGAAGGPGGTGANGNPGKLQFKVAPPAVGLTSISPTAGPLAGGTPVTITGQNFVADGTGALVTTFLIGGTALVGGSYVSSTTVTGTTPPGANTGPASLVAQNPDGTAAFIVNAFTYQ